MEAGTIAPADVDRAVVLVESMGLQWRPGLLPRLTPESLIQMGLEDELQWRPGLLPRLTSSCPPYLLVPILAAMEAGTIAPADSE